MNGVMKDGSGKARALFLALLAFPALAALSSCRTGNDPVSPQDEIYLRLDAVPILLAADSSSTATIWATLLIKGRPAPDSTTVHFVASDGQIDPVGYTEDGLASVIYMSSGEVGSVSIVGQALAVRDTVNLTIY